MAIAMIVDQAGYRLNVGIILINNAGRVFWGRRAGHDAWQFPQGGVAKGESIEKAMHRELHEEVGLDVKDVAVLAVTRRWLHYRLPKQYLRRGTTPLVVGQKQKWFLLRLLVSDQKIRLDLSEAPEFDSWRWIDAKDTAANVIFFKRQVYHLALKEFDPIIQSIKVQASS